MLQNLTNRDNGTLGTPGLLKGLPASGKITIIIIYSRVTRKEYIRGGEWPDHIGWVPPVSPGQYLGFDPLWQHCGPR